MMRKMDQEHLEHPSKGVVSMTDFLLDEGYRVGQRRVRRLMRLMAFRPSIRRSTRVFPDRLCTSSRTCCEG